MVNRYRTRIRQIGADLVANKVKACSHSANKRQEFLPLHKACLSIVCEQDGAALLYSARRLADACRRICGALEEVLEKHRLLSREKAVI